MSGPEITPLSADAQAASPTSRLERMELIFGPIPLPLEDEDESDPFEDAEAEASARLASLVVRLGGTIDASGVGRNCECPHCGVNKLILRLGRKQMVLWCEGCKVPSQFLLECLSHNCGIRFDRPEPLPEPPADIVASLSPKARVLFLALVAQAHRSPADANGHYCFTYDRVAKQLCIRRNDIKALWDELVDKGLVVRECVFGRNVPGKPRLNYYGLPHLPGLNTGKPAKRSPAPERTMHISNLVTVNETERPSTPIKHHTTPATIVVSNNTAKNVDHTPPSPAAEEPPPEGFSGVPKARSEQKDGKRRQRTKVQRERAHTWAREAGFGADDDWIAFQLQEWADKARRREADRRRVGGLQ